MYGNTDSRIVVISSALYKKGKLDWNNIGLKNGYTPEKAYANSKLANLLFIRTLNERLSKDRSGQPGAGRIKVYATHPGIVDTDISRYYTKSPLRKFGWWFAQKLILRNPDEGNAANLQVLLKPTAELVSGGYYGNGLIKSGPVKNESETLNPVATDDESAKRL